MHNSFHVSKIKLRALGSISSILKGGLYLYLLALLVVWALIWFTGDRWWFGTVLLYGPRWIYACPLVIFIPYVVWQKKLLWILILTVLVFLGPILGFNIPSKVTIDSQQPVYRVLTYNVQRWEVTGEEFSKLLDEINPDFAAVQEHANPRFWKLPPKWFVKPAGYSIIVSRFPIVRVETSRGKPHFNGVYCVIETPDGPIGFANVDLLTPRRALKTLLDRNKVFDLTQVDYAQKQIQNRWQESEKIFQWLENFPEPKIIAGDFNLTVDSTIYRKYWSKYQNAFSKTEFGFGHTKKTKINIFRYKARIDHILSTSDMKPLRSWVGPDLGSDHLPLIADIAFTAVRKKTLPP